ncbi:MAG: hypothetical protein AAGE98_18090 [Actinomycetota bacterium]
MTFERELRDMLHRRAGDIDGPTTLRPVEQPGGHTTMRLVAVAASVAMLAGLFGWFLNERETPTTEIGDDLAAEPPTTTSIAADEAGAGPAGTSIPADSTEEPPIDAWRAGLPADFDPLWAPQVAAYPGPIDHREAAERYLRSELADLGDRVQITDIQEASSSLTVLRWQWSDGPGASLYAGYVVLRDQDEVTLVVAVTTDGVDASMVRRTTSGIGGEITHRDADTLAADVVVFGAPAPNSPQLTTGIDDDLGTAGFTSRPTLDLDVPLDRFRNATALVTIRHVGGTILSITSFGITSPGFASPCTSPSEPVNLGIGPWFDSLVDGPLPDSRWPTLANQERTHAVGDFGSIEVMRPALPEILPIPDPQASQDRQAITSTTTALDGFSTEENVFIGFGTDPCDWMQFSLRGDPEAVAWWRDAITGQWTFDVPLSLADLDPAELGAATPGSPAEPVPDLVAGGRVAEQLPTVPLTGSCDGLPDAAPFVGTGPDQRTPSTVEALEAFLATEPLDGMLPSQGYVVIEGPDDTLGYVIEGDRSAVVVIAVERGVDGWRVSRWEAAAC